MSYQTDQEVGEAGFQIEAVLILGENKDADEVAFEKTIITIVVITIVVITIVVITIVVVTIVVTIIVNVIVVVIIVCFT